MKKGFTLIEILVVVSITAIISSFALIYTKSSQSQVTLQIEEQKIASFIFRAKSLAITTYSRLPATRSCGYGLEINYATRNYWIFSYEPPIDPTKPSTCPDVTAIQSRYQVAMTSSTLPKELIFDQQPAAKRLRLVLFLPPAPRTLLSNNSGNSGDLDRGGALNIYLSTRDGLAKRTITVGSAGQIDL